MPDSRASIWDTEPDEHAGRADGGRWSRPLEALHRLSGALALGRSQSPGQARHERSSGEMTTVPQGGRGHALRDAHRSLRRHLRQHRALHSLLPHLCYIEQALARQGSAALVDMPLWVLQRGLRQLDRLPWDPHPEPVLHPLNTLRLRLIEAVEIRKLHGEVRQPGTPGRSGDAFSGRADSRFGEFGPDGSDGPDSLPPAGIVVEDAGDSGIDDPPRPPDRPGPSPGRQGPYRR